MMMIVMVVVMKVMIMITVAMIVLVRVIVLRMDVDGAGMYTELDPGDPFARLPLEMQMVVFDPDFG
jgi:hypothetical protein